jgi:hypothetical protein
VSTTIAKAIWAIIDLRVAKYSGVNVVRYAAFILTISIGIVYDVTVAPGYGRLSPGRGRALASQHPTQSEDGKYFHSHDVLHGIVLFVITTTRCNPSHYVKIVLQNVNSSVTIV